MSEERERYSRFRSERSPEKQKPGAQSDRRDRDVSRDRGRDRQRDTSRHRDRSRSRRNQREEFVPVGQVEELLKNQQANLLEIITSHKDDVDSMLKPTKHNFRKSGLEKQYLFLTSLDTKLKKARKYIKKENYEKSKDTVDDISSMIEEQIENLIIADQSRHSWLTVSLLRNKFSDLPTDVQKKVNKLENKLDKTRSDRNGQAERNTGGRYQSSTRSTSGYQSNTGFQKKGYPKAAGPEELMARLRTTTRQGQCTFCQETGHFYKECPGFWREVTDLRKKGALSSTA